MRNVVQRARVAEGTCKHQHCLDIVNSNLSGSYTQMDEDVILQLMLEDDDDDEEEEQIRDYDDDEIRFIQINFEDWKRLGDPMFQESFRMDRVTFERLLVAVGWHLEQHDRILRPCKNGLDFSLMMVLWILATPDTFRSVAVKFFGDGHKKGVVHFHYKYIIEALREMLHSYICWPQAWEQEEVAAAFEHLYGYPSVIGCIDGCLIRVTAPLEQPQQYVDWHRHYSIQLQGICDHQMLFRDIYVGEPGSVGDKRCFKRSPIGRSVLRRPEVMGDKHLLGDGGYTLTSKLLIPYRNNGHLTRRMRAHNYFLSRSRCTIERAFALLKGKWRRLKYLQSYCVEYAVDHIVACCVLHNFIILEGESYEGHQLDLRNAPPMNINDRQLLREAKQVGALKRDFIAAMLSPADE